MRLLLDSHAFLWFIGGDSRLSSRARAAVEGEASIVWLSYASLWELNIKRAAGRLTLLDPLAVMVEQGGFQLLRIELNHIEAAADLPPYHGDPFDRMLVAQAVEEGLTLVTADKALRRYPVAWLW